MRLTMSEPDRPALTSSTLALVSAGTSSAMDTFAINNSFTKKELVGRTYAGVEGYCPFADYLGSVVELTVDTALGAIFVISSDVTRQWRLGDTLTLRLPASGISVVPV